MKHDEILSAYFRHIPVIKKIGATPLYKPIAQKDLGLKRGEILKGYRDRVHFNFKGNLVDFFCWLSTWNLCLSLIIAYKEPKQISTLMYLHQQVRPYDLHNTLRLYFKDKIYLFEALRETLIVLTYDKIMVGDTMTLVSKPREEAEKLIDEKRIESTIKSLIEYANKKIKIEMKY